MRLARRAAVAALVVAAGLLVAPAGAGAQALPSPNASCEGTISSFVGQFGVRSDIAPAPGSEVRSLAQQHSGGVLLCLIGP